MLRLFPFTTKMNFRAIQIILIWYNKSNYSRQMIKSQYTKAYDTESQERKYRMANTKHEDAIMKLGFDYFKEIIVKALDVNYRFIDSAPTELVELKIHNMYMDFTFLTDKDIYIHFEFQTTDSGDADLRRFHAYETVLANNTGKNVITYVIYSDGIRRTKDVLDCGVYTYRVIPIYFTDKSADKVFQKLEEKKKKNLPFLEEDFAELALTPLMSSTYSRKDTIKKAIIFAKPYTGITSEKVISMLYTLADKFLDNPELREIKEVVAMTRLGQMLFDDGMEKGMEKGIQIFIQDNYEEGITRERIIDKLIRHFDLTREKAENYYDRFTSRDVVSPK